MSKCAECENLMIPANKFPCDNCPDVSYEHRMFDKANRVIPDIKKLSEFEAILQPIAELLERKNTDYGNSFDQLREKYGPVGFHIRVADKLNRIEQLDKHPAQVKDEAIEDTIRDIIGYCTLELNFRQERQKVGNNEDSKSQIR